MKRGRFGLPRFSSVGPLKPGGFIFNQPDSAQEVDQFVEEYIEENNIDFDTDRQDDVEEVLNAVAEEIFPESERRQERLKACVESEWADGWSDGFMDSSGANNAEDAEVVPLEKVSMSAAGCKGMVEANTLGP